MGGVIQAVNISKQYMGAAVLQNFSIMLKQGETLALMGPSGSGKTTLARILMGLEKPNTGTLTFPPDMRISCVFQENRLFSELSALQNIALVLRRAKWMEIPQALLRLGLSKQDMSKAVGQLSGGQKRRVALARALEAPGDFLVLDEAFKGLDLHTRQLAFDYIRLRRQGRTLLLVSHDEEEAAQCERRVVLTPAARPASAHPSIL